MNYDPQELELVKKLDKRIVPMAILLLSWSLLIKLDLVAAYGDNGELFSWAGKDSDYVLLISKISFQIGTLVFILPFCMLIRYFNPKAVFSVAEILAVSIMFLLSLAEDKNFLVVMLFFLGASLGGYFVSLALYILYFYTKEETATRYALITSISYAISILASNIYGFFLKDINLDSGYERWQCMNLIHSFSGVLVAIMTFWNLPAFPEDCKLLNPAERSLAIARGLDGMESTQPFSSIRNSSSQRLLRFDINHFLEAISDLKLWFYTFIYSGLEYCAESSIGSSRLIIDKLSMEIAGNDSFLMKVFQIIFWIVILLFGVVIAYFNSKDSDKKTAGGRMWNLVGGLLLLGFGSLMMCFPSFPIFVQYILGALPGILGLFASLPCLVASATDNTFGDTYRITTTAIVAGFGNFLGSICFAIHSHILSTKDQFQSISSISSTVISFVFSIIVFVFFKYKEAKESIHGPGLRRLLNDADEAKAWDIELNDMDFMKTIKTNKINDNINEFEEIMDENEEF